jgi:hypothetical protein
MYLTNYSSSKSPTNAGTKPNIFKLPEEKERPETAYSSNDKKKVTNVVGITSPETNIMNKKFTPTNQTPSTSKLINMNYQVGMNRSPIPETSSTPNLNKQGGLNKYSFLNSGANRPQGYK